jgi:hypothetical protein
MSNANSVRHHNPMIKAGACVMVGGVYTSIIELQITEFGMKLLLSGWNADGFGDFGTDDSIQVWCGRKSRFVKVLEAFNFQFVWSKELSSRA